MSTIDLHYAGTFLNPYLLGEVHLLDDVSAKEALNIFCKKNGIPTAYALALEDFVNFVKSQGPIFDMTLVKNLDLHPHEWWDLIGVGGCTLAPITHCILAQVCSTSSCKRN
jgi:hypothetical protein